MENGYRIHPNAVLIFVILMILTSVTAVFGEQFGIPQIVRIAISAPGLCAGTLLVFQHARIYQKVTTQEQLKEKDDAD